MLILSRSTVQTTNHDNNDIFFRFSYWSRSLSQCVVYLIQFYNFQKRLDIYKLNQASTYTRAYSSGK